MCNVIFIDYCVLLNDANNINELALQHLANIKNKIDDIKIVCIDTKQEMQAMNYDVMLNILSQKLNLKKTLFFDTLYLDSYDEACGKISSWISINEVKAFAIVVKNECFKDIANAYANNYVVCNEFSENIENKICWILSNFGVSMDKSDNIWFISDTHFYHANIIRYCNRPWNNGKDDAGNIVVTEDNVEQMNNEMVRRWNSIVSKDDIVWHLGDFSFGGKENLEKIFPQLNGKINLVMGNHDHYKIDYYYDVGFHRVYDRNVIINDFVVLSHAPLHFLNCNSPFFNIYGHIHDSSVYQTYTKCNCCVCVERHDYTPVSWKTIKQKYEELNEQISTTSI